MVDSVDRPQSAANAASDGAFYELVAQYNDLAAKFEDLLQKLDGDAGVANDYESSVGESKQVHFKETGAPTAS